MPVAAKVPALQAEVRGDQELLVPLTRRASQNGAIVTNADGDLPPRGDGSRRILASRFPEAFPEGFPEAFPDAFDNLSFAQNLP